MKKIGKLAISLGAIATTVSVPMAMIACGTKTETLSDDVKVLGDAAITTGNGVISGLLKTVVAANKATLDFTFTPKNGTETTYTSAADFNVNIELVNKGWIWDAPTTGPEAGQYVIDPTKTSGNVGHGRKLDPTKDTYITYMDNTMTKRRAVKFSEKGLDFFFTQMANGSIDKNDYSTIKQALEAVLKKTAPAKTTGTSLKSTTLADFTSFDATEIADKKTIASVNAYFGIKLATTETEKIFSANFDTTTGVLTYRHGASSVSANTGEEVSVTIEAK